MAIPSHLCLTWARLVAASLCALAATACGTATPADAGVGAVDAAGDAGQLDAAGGPDSAADGALGTDASADQTAGTDAIAAAADVPDSAVADVAHPDAAADVAGTDAAALDTAPPCPAGATCDDGNACTVGDHCAGGACVSGPAVDCNDNNPCTSDGCSAKTGCQHSPASGPCADDGNPCTTDACANSVCAHTPAIGAFCTDHNACTVGDACSGGVCVAGTSPNCDDGNACTADSCAPASGACVHTAIAGCGTASAPAYADVNNQIFTPLCSGCHGSQMAYAAIVNVASGDATYTKFVDPGNPNNSAVLMAVDATLPLAWGDRMPKGNPAAMTPTLVKLMRDWIQGGALP